MCNFAPAQPPVPSPVISNSKICLFSAPLTRFKPFIIPTYYFIIIVEIWAVSDSYSRISPRYIVISFSRPQPPAPGIFMLAVSLITKIVFIALSLL